MAERLIQLRLTPREMYHIEVALQTLKDDGCYFGQRKYFYARTEALLKRFTALRESS